LSLAYRLCGAAASASQSVAQYSDIWGGQPGVFSAGYGSTPCGPW
jgi:hypothetical protein